MDSIYIAIIILSLLSNILIFILHRNWKSNRYEREIENEEELKREREKRLYLQAELDKVREVHTSHTKEIEAENKMYKVIIEDLEKTIARYSEEEREYYSEMDNLNSMGKEISPGELFILRDLSGQKGSGVHDFTGIYILENKTEDKFYVGQSISVLKRASKHFTGDGNKGIYEDYKNGDKWTVKMIALSDSGFKSINALEKHFIKYHSSTYNGYNKTIGNAN